MQTPLRNRLPDPETEPEEWEVWRDSFPPIPDFLRRTPELEKTGREGLEDLL